MIYRIESETESNEVVTLKKLSVWDNDMSPFPEYIDVKNKIYYRNDWAITEMYDVRYRIMLKDSSVGYKFNTRGKKIHNDDVGAYVTEMLGEGFKIIKF